MTIEQAVIYLANLKAELAVAIESNSELLSVEELTIDIDKAEKEIRRIQGN